MDLCRESVCRLCRHRPEWNRLAILTVGEQGEGFRARMDRWLGHLRWLRDSVTDPAVAAEKRWGELVSRSGLLEGPVEADQAGRMGMGQASQVRDPDQVRLEPDREHVLATAQVQAKGRELARETAPASAQVPAAEVAAALVRVAVRAMAEWAPVPAAAMARAGQVRSSQVRARTAAETGTVRLEMALAMPREMAVEVGMQLRVPAADRALPRK